MGGNVQGDDRSIHYTDVGGPIDLECGVHYASLVPRQHGRRADRVVFSGEAGGRGVGREVSTGAGDDLSTKDRLVLRGGSDFPHICSASGRHRDIEWHRVVLRIDDGIDGGVARLDVDGATGEEVLLRSKEGRVGCVRRRRYKVDEETVERDELHLTNRGRVALEECQLLLERRLVWRRGGRDICGGLGNEGLGL